MAACGYVRTHVVVLRITYFEEYYYKLRLMYELRAYAADCTCMGMSRMQKSLTISYTQS
jgi:hypothetical protein